MEDKRTYHHYLSTSLVFERNITLADVNVEETPLEVIVDRLKLYQARVRFHVNNYGIIDPRAELRNLKKKEDVKSMLTDFEVE